MGDDNVGDATAQSLDSNVDICEQLLTRYAHSSAAQHRHLCATAAATRSIIQSSSLPLTPLSYFAATITSLSNSDSLDSTALAALTSFLSIVLPLVHNGEINPDKARDAVGVLMRIVEESGAAMGTSSVRAVVKCVGVLVAQFCNSSDWESIALGFEWLLKFSLDKRPKVRKCAQDCLLAVVKSFESSAILKKASKSIFLLLKDHMPLAIEMAASEIGDGSRDESVSRTEHQEVIHFLNLMKHVAPYLSLKFRTRTLSQMLKILSSKFSAVTRHVIEVISVIFETSAPDVVISNAEGIFKSLVCYMGEKNPVDSVLFAGNLAKAALVKLHDSDMSEWTTYFPMITESLAGLLASKANIALETSKILRELIDRHIDGKGFETIKRQEMEDKTTQNAELRAIGATCAAFYNVLNASPEIPNEHFFSVVAYLFLRLGEISDIFMERILLKLADIMNAIPAGSSRVKHLQDCIGSAAAAMGPQRLLELLPISLSTSDFSCSNTWLIPILQKNVVGSSLQFFMEHIVPLAESFSQASCKVEKSVIGQDLQAYAHGCWGLLPAFCRLPCDTHKSFGSLTELLIPFLKKDSLMLQNIATALQELVNENKNALATNQGSEELREVQRTGNADEFPIDFRKRFLYSERLARKNMKTIALCSEGLLHSLINVFLESPLETRKLLKGAVSCLASVCDTSVTKHIFIASVERYQLLKDINEHGEMVSGRSGVADENENVAIFVGNDAKRCLILELASCIIEGSDSDVVNLVFSVIKRALQVTDEVSQIEAYQTFSKILESHSWFCSSQYAEVMDLLTGMKSSGNATLLKSRFACLQTLLIHALTIDTDEENPKAFLILNEIILTLKDSDEEGRKVAYDALHGISSRLRNSLDASRDVLYHKLLTMITGYLSGSSPHIKSGVVSALSVLVYNDPDISIKVPDVVPSVLELLHSKAVEVIKAVLGFVKVLVSCLKPDDLQRLLPDIMDGIIRWSSVSRHHFKTKIVVILEIMMRKCGSAAVKGLVPEKYKDFVQGVVVNRHGKTSSKDAANKDTKPGLTDLSTGGQQKRKRVANSSKDGSVRPWKKNRGHKKPNNAGKPMERAGHSDQGKSSKHRGGTERDFRGRKTSSGTKIKDRTSMKRSNASQFSKQRRKIGKKAQKIS